MGASKKSKIHGIIHSASTAAAAVGAGMAQIPGSDCIPLAAIQKSMICAIALLHGQKINNAAATGVLGIVGATVTGRSISQLLVGWIPVYGNAINATTAATLTELVGWGAHKYFEDLE